MLTSYLLVFLINQLTDLTTEYQTLSFLDAFSGYHQIQINFIDERKVSFITDEDTFYYVQMPFGLKNVA